MLSDAQKVVFKGIADNKAQFECLKEFLTQKIELKELPLGMSSADLGSYVKARYDVAKVITDAFTEIASYRTRPPSEDLVNPAR